MRPTSLLHVGLAFLLPLAAFAATGSPAEFAAPMARGKLDRLMQHRNALPSPGERAALDARQRELARQRGAFRIVVHPIRIGRSADSGCAGEIASRLCRSRIAGTACVGPSVPLATPDTEPNDERALWDLAREFRASLKSHPSDGDYALYADFAFDPDRREQGFVRFVLCDAQGEWVMVDFQNAHHASFQRFPPASKFDCCAILMQRIESYLANAVPDEGDVGSQAPVKSPREDPSFRVTRR